MSQQKTTTYDITGMTCAACANRIEKNLNKLNDVTANVNVTTEKATVTYDPQSTSETQITESIEKTGYGVSTEHTDLDIIGMTCAACSNRIEKVLNRMDGISNASINLTTESGAIDYNPYTVTVDDIISRIQQIGYDAQTKQDETQKASRKEQELKGKR